MVKERKIFKDIIKKYEDNALCTICLDEFKLSDEIHISKCKHIFHYKCIEESINKNSSDCPNCRSNLKTGEKKNVASTNNNIYNLWNVDNNLRYDNNINNINNMNNNIRYDNHINNMNHNIRYNEYQNNRNIVRNRDSEEISATCYIIIIIAILWISSAFVQSIV